MSDYPGAIDEFRVTQNLPGIIYEPEDTTTVFAEDTNNLNSAVHAIETTLGANPQGDFTTVADRLAAGGGGGGAWETIFDYTSSGGDSELTCDYLDLQTDKLYKVFFGVACANETTQLQFSGASAISFGWQGILINGGSISGIAAPPFLSHPSISGGTGEMTISTTDNGTARADLRYSLMNQRAYDFQGVDTNWYTGGINLTRFKIKTLTDYYMSTGSYLRILKWVS